METSEVQNGGVEVEVTKNDGTDTAVVVAEKPTRKRVSRADFITAWEETVKGLTNGTLKGAGAQIVADRLGLKVATVRQQSTKYRTEYKVPLSNMPRGGGSRFNSTEANALLNEIKAKLNGDGAKGDTETLTGVEPTTGETGEAGAEVVGTVS